MKYSEKTKNKREFKITRDLIRLGIEKYIIYTMKMIKSELNGESTLKIIDLKMLNEISDEKIFETFYNNYKL